MSARIGDESGFTLVELLVTMVIGIIVLGGGTYGIAMAFRQSTEVSDRIETTSNAEVGLQALTDDLRVATTCPTGTEDSSGNEIGGSSGGISYTAGTGQELEFCIPLPGANASALGEDALVTWTCAPVSPQPSWAGTYTVSACARQFQQITPTSATATQWLGTAQTNTHIYGIQSLKLTGLIGAGSSAKVASLSTATTTTGCASGASCFDLSGSDANSIGWVGIQAAFYDLTVPSNPSDPQNSDIVAKTKPITVNTGAELRNYGT